MYFIPSSERSLSRHKCSLQRSSHFFLLLVKDVVAKKDKISGRDNDRAEKSVVGNNNRNNLEIVVVKYTAGMSWQKDLKNTLA